MYTVELLVSIDDRNYEVKKSYKRLYHAENYIKKIKNKAAKMIKLLKKFTGGQVNLLLIIMN